MDRGGDASGRHDDRDDALEIIDLETGEPVESRREAPPPKGPQRRRAPLVIAALVVGALVVSTVVAGTRHSTRSAASATTGSDRSVVLGGKAGLFSVRLGAQILTGGSRLHLVDTDTARVTTPRVRGLPAGVVTIVAHSGGTVAVRVARHLYWFTLPSGAAHRVRATTAFPGVRSGFIWLASARSATQVPGPRDVIATPGRAIGATNDGLIVPTAAGIVLEREVDATEVLVPRPAIVIAVHPDRIAWVDGTCGELRCPVHVREMASGATATWLQLVGGPNPLSVAGASAMFSPDGARLAVVVPDAGAIAAASLMTANLRTRAVRVVDLLSRVDQPARPGTDDATGMTIDWTTDGTALVLAPRSGENAGLLGVVDPDTGTVNTTNTRLDVGESLAAVGVSSDGSRDLVRRHPIVAVDRGGPTTLGLPGLTLVASGADRVDVLDLGTNTIQTFRVGGTVTDPHGDSDVARVRGGWLAVRGSVAMFLPDDPTASYLALAPASEVFAGNDGRVGWIANSNGDHWTVESYDPATGALGAPLTVSTPVGAVDAGLVVAHPLTSQGTVLGVVGTDGRVTDQPPITTNSVTVVAAAGNHVAFTNGFGLELLDLSTGRYGLVTKLAAHDIELSPDGTDIAWIGQVTPGGSTDEVLAAFIDPSSTHLPRVFDLGDNGDRVFVTDNADVIYTTGGLVRRGRVGTEGSRAVSGLAPDPSAQLSLG